MTKKRVRRSILSLILALAMVLSLIPVPAMADPGDEEQGGEPAEERTTGLFATDWLEWPQGDEPGEPTEGEEPNRYEFGTDRPDMDLYVVNKAEEGEDGDVVSAENLKLYKLTEEGTAGDEVENCVRKLPYWDGNGDAESEKFVKLYFPDAGDYLLCHTDDIDKEQGIIIHMNYPWVGAYSADEKSTENYISESTCLDGSTEFYIIENFELDDGQEFSYGEWERDENNNNEPISFTKKKERLDLSSVRSDYIESDKKLEDFVTVEQVGGEIGSRVYKVTVRDMPMDADWDLWFEAALLEGDQEPQDCSRRIWVRNPLRTTGLLATNWVDWDNGIPALGHYNDGENDYYAEPEAREMGVSLPDTTIYAVYKASEDAEEVPSVKAEDLHLYKMENGTVGAKVPDDEISQYSYWQEGKDEITSTDFVRLHFPDAGDYLLCYQEETGTKQGIIIHVDFPELGIYSDYKQGLKADALQSSTEIICREDTYVFYLIENIENIDKEKAVSYGRWTHNDETGEDVFEKSELPCVQDENIKAKVTTIDKTTVGQYVYKVEVDISDFEYWESRPLDFNGEYERQEYDLENEDDRYGSVSCFVDIKRMMSGLVGFEYYGDEILEEDYVNCFGKNVDCWDYEAQIAFGWMDDDGEFTDKEAWSEMTAEIYDRDENLKVTGKFVENNRFKFKLSEFEFGEYDIVLKKGNKEFGRMTLSLQRGWGWFFDGYEERVDDRLGWVAAWGTDDKYFNPLAERKHKFASAPSLVFYGPENAKFYQWTGGYEEGKAEHGNEISPSKDPEKLDDYGYTRYTLDAQDLYNGGDGKFVACYTDLEYDEITVEVVQLHREHEAEAYEGPKYYSGLFITEEEYNQGNWDFEGTMRIEEPTYWAFGKTMQEVLDKLKKKADGDSSYNYEYINISTGLSDEDLSGRQDNEILNVGNGDLKGLRLYANNDFSWSNLTIKGSLKEDDLILISGSWQDGAELNIGPKLRANVDYYCYEDSSTQEYHNVIFPDVLEDENWPGEDETAVKDGLKVQILKNSYYGSEPTTFTVQYAISEKEADEKDIKGEFIQSDADKELVTIEVAPSKGEAASAQSITDTIDFDDKVVEAILSDDDAKLKTELTIESDENKPASVDAKDAIEAAMKEEGNPSSKVPDTAKKIQFIDISLKVVVVDKNGATKKDDENKDIAQEVTETKSELAISIPLPADLKWTPAATSKAKNIVYNVYRYHEGIAEKVNDVPLSLTVTGTLTFRTDKFSTYAIEAVENEAQSIAVTKMPTKTTYTEGEVFSKEGMEVSVTYLDGTVEKTTEYTVDKTTALAKTDTTVTVAWKGLTAQVPITVSAKQDPGKDPAKDPSKDPSKDPAKEPTKEPAAAVGETATVGGNNYKVTAATGTNKTVTFTAADKKAAKVTVPATVNIKGAEYKVTVIGDNAFAGNAKLTTVTMPAGITKIGKNAFKNCTKLKKIDIAKSVTEIGTNAFYNCKKLTTVKFKGTKIKKIGQGAFAKCASLKSVTIPKSVTEIGKDAFKDCKKLSKVTIKGTVLKKVGKNAFKNIAKKSVIKVPKKKKAAYKKLLKSAGYTKTVK